MHSALANLPPRKGNGVWGLGPQNLLFLLPLLTSCSHPTPTTGIASLNPCTDAILAEVAQPRQIAALSAYSRDPRQTSMDLARARSLPSTGGTVEELAVLRPAMVVASNMTPPATRAALARLGIPLVEFPIATTLSESEAQVRRIAALAGQPARGEALVAQMQAAVRAAAPPPAARPIPALVWQGGGMVAGQGTLVSELLARTGFANFAHTRGLTQAQVLPLERVLADPPAVILVAGHPQSQEDRLLRHPALAHLRHTRTVPFDPALEWCGGPTVIHAAARLAEIRRSLGA
jgi:iron complex transport system substrate-binding protein